MGDKEISEMWNAHKEESKERRSSNREQSAKMLDGADIQYQRKNGGAHLIVQGPDCLIDFWPGTGRWHSRNDKAGFGVRNLIKFIKR